jgi:phosphoribosylpyrophosphate synthetase
MASKKISNYKRKKSLIKKQLGGILNTEQLAILGNRNELSLDKYVILSCREFEPLAQSLVSRSPSLFIKGNVTWTKYPDGTPKMFLDEYTVKMLRGRHIIYLAYFSFNEPNSTNILSQYMLLSSLASYGINKLHIILPYYPTGTMERIQIEGELGTGYYLAHFFNSIPCGNSKNELYVIDMHALCTRFFFHTNVKMTFVTMFAKYVQIINANPGPSFVVFPDDGAEKRNKQLCEINKVKFITCAKKRDKDERTIQITGSLTEVISTAHTNLQKLRKSEKIDNINLFIMDDLIQTGGTAGTTILELNDALKTKLNEQLVKDTVLNDEEWSQLIKYKLLITHSILPVTDSTEPTITSVKSIFIEKLNFNSIPNLDFVTTDTRPNMANMLTQINTEEGLLKGRITVISIDDILLSIFTDINTPYITPFK